MKKTNTYKNFDTRVSFKPLIGAAVAIIVCVTGIFVTTFMLADNIRENSSAAGKEKISIKAKNAKKVYPARELHSSTVGEIKKKESIPSYSSDEIMNMDVSRPSGVTVADLKLVTVQGLAGLEEAFLKAEKDYGVNCLFVMGIASLESANGTMCFRPNNMFGFGNSGFSSKAECIDVVSRSLAENYLSPGGSLYNGKKISDVNVKYASSSTWDDKVARNMAGYYATISKRHNAVLDKLD